MVGSGAYPCSPASSYFEERLKAPETLPYPVPRYSVRTYLAKVSRSCSDTIFFFVVKKNLKSVTTHSNPSLVALVVGYTLQGARLSAALTKHGASNGASRRERNQGDPWK